jgi:hypothetical protein
VDHTNFLGTIRAEIVRQNVARAAITRPAPTVASPTPSVARPASSGARPALSEASLVAVETIEQETVADLDDDSDSGSDFEIYDSDYDAEEGDDDLFIDNVDSSVNDNNERVVFVQTENKDALDDRDLHLVDDERQQLQLKFKEFNPEVDMDSLVFKIGMKFADIEEVRQAVNAYSIRNRVKIRKIKNNRARVHAVCDEGCPWFLKVGTDFQRSGGFVVTAYEDEHRCERVYEMRALTARFLCKKFIDEFRDNQKNGSANICC